MTISISIFVCFVALLSVTHANECPDRQCFLSRNEQNEVVFDCSLGRVNSSDTEVTCYHFAPLNKLILSTKQSQYIPVDKIAPGAFSRLISGIRVHKIYINKLQFKTLEKDDFEGLLDIWEMRVENPKILASDTFTALATKTKFFVLTISCVKGNSENSFDFLYLMSVNWRLFTNNCYKKLSCEYSDCDKDSQGKVTKITSSDVLVSVDHQLGSRSCSISPLCIKTPVTPTTIKQKPGTSAIRQTTSKRTISEEKSIKENQSDDSYHSVMYVVLILTSINSIVILGILVFLISWWTKLSTSATNNKHTIILDDKDDSTFLKTSPYA